MTKFIYSILRVVYSFHSHSETNDKPIMMENYKGRSEYMSFYTSKCKLFTRELNETHELSLESLTMKRDFNLNTKLQFKRKI